jgi:hemolysin activation/secretion protein
MPWFSVTPKGFIMKLSKQLVFSCLSLLLFQEARAEFGAFIPSSALPSQVGQAIKNQNTPVPIPNNRPAMAKKTTDAIPKEMEKIKFKLNGIILTGNHVYPTSELEKFYQDKIGKKVSMAEIFAVIQAITNFYRNNGYVLSRALLPAQTVKNGIIHIQIVEGYIGRVSVTGQPAGARSQVLLIGNRITEHRPIDIAWMQKYLILENEIPGTQVRAVIEASHEKIPEIGSSDLNLVTENKLVTGYISYDNYGTRYIGPQQITGNVGLNSFMLSGDLTQLTLVKTPKGAELTYVDVNYNLPTGNDGSRLLIGNTYVNTNPQFILGDVNLNGKNENAYLTETYPVIRALNKSLTLRGGFNYLNTSSTSFNFLLYKDQIRSIDLGGTYSFADSFKGSNILNGDFRQGLPILGYTPNTSVVSANTSRPGGHAVYSKIVLSYSRLQALKGPISLSGLITGQYVPNAVLSAEQFSFGGPQLGRGYDVAEILGDKGAAASLELRYDKTVERFYLSNLQFYLFYDAGVVWNYLFVGNVPLKQDGTSTGAGVRFFMTKYLSGNLMWTQPLTKKVATEEIIANGSAPRVWFSLVLAAY